MKKLSIVLLSSLMLSACAEMPDTAVTRHQIDDLSDSDHDGVINQRDLCSETPQGVSVDSKGCTEWQITEHMEVISVEFDFDKYIIKPEHAPALNQITSLLEEHKESVVTLVGDTSSEGTNTYNKELAAKRTGVIKRELMKRGINGDRVLEQEFTQITSLTQHLHKRKRRTIAVIGIQKMEVDPAWDIFTSERNLESNSDVSRPMEVTNDSTK